jgi:hypothetical protein
MSLYKKLALDTLVLTFGVIWTPNSTKYSFRFMYFYFLLIEVPFYKKKKKLNKHANKLSKKRKENREAKRKNIKNNR